MLHTLCIGVNATVGSGVFALPDDMQRAMGGYSPLAYLLCALVLLPVTLCFVELSSRIDETGGSYIYALRAFGPRIGFVTGWFCLIANLVSWAANATLFVDLLGFHGATGHLIAALLVIFLGAINYYGIKPGAWLIILMTAGKLAAIACFLGVAAGRLDLSRLGGSLPHGAWGVGSGVYLALFPLQGFETTPIAAGETENSRQIVPLATLGTLLFSTLLFMIVQAALVCAYPALATPSSHPLVDAARSFGVQLGAIVLAGSILATGGFSAGCALGSPRYAEAMAQHEMLPPWLAARHPRRDTPHRSIIVITGLTAVMALFFDYRRLVGMSNITVVTQYVMTCLAVPYLRKEPSQGQGQAKPWTIPGGAVIPVVGALGSLILLSGADRTETLFAAVTLLAGLAVMFWRRR
ncbi:MAG TPA: APC family permease [Polyangia bacterium]|jgi:amino acid transporter|nr:APC family permease [Polyangia bacterium]